jgi:hypothetical protein
MKAIAITEVNGQTEIQVETGAWIFKHVTTYRTSGKIAGDYYRWVKLPDKMIVHDVMSFQLDSWKRMGID